MTTETPELGKLSQAAAHQDETNPKAIRDDSAPKRNGLAIIVAETFGYLVIAGLVSLAGWWWNGFLYLTLLGLFLFLVSVVIWYLRFRQVRPAPSRRANVEDKASAEGNGFVVVLTEAVGYLCIAGLGCLMSALWYGYSLAVLLGLISIATGALLSTVGAIVWYRRSRRGAR